MARVAIVGFDTGDGSECNPQGISGTGSFFSVANGYAFRSNPIGTATGFVGITPISVLTAPRFKTEFWYEIKPTSGSEPILFIDKSFDQDTFEIRIDSDGKLSFWKTTSTPTQLGLTGSTALQQGVHYRIEFSLASNFWEIRLGEAIEDGSVELSGTDSIVVSTALFKCGKSTNRNGNSVDFYYDHVSVDDSEYPGLTYMRMLVANDIGDYQGGSDRVGCSVNWQCLDEIPPDGDTTFLRRLNTGDAETEFLTPLDVSVEEIKVVKAITVARSRGTNLDYKVRVRVGTVDNDSSQFTVGTTYGAGINLSTISPATSLPWTLSEVNSVQSGVFIVDDHGDLGRLTFVGASVEYVPVTEAFVEPNRVIEDNEARPILGAKSYQVSQTTSGESTFTLGHTLSRVIGQVESGEMVSSLDFFKAKQIAMVVEGGVSRPLTSSDTKLVNRVIEGDDLFSMDFTKEKGAGQVVEDSIVSTITAGKSDSVGQITTEEIAVSLGFFKTGLVGFPVEQSMACEVSSGGAFFASVINEENVASQLGTTKVKSLGVVVSDENVNSLQMARTFLVGPTVEESTAFAVLTNIFKVYEESIITSTGSAQKVVEVSQVTELNFTLLVNHPIMDVGRVIEESSIHPFGPNIQQVTSEESARRLAIVLSNLVEECLAFTVHVFIVPRVGDSQYIAQSRKPEYQTNILSSSSV